MEVLITAQQAIEIHEERGQERIEEFNMLVNGNPKGFRIRDTNSRAAEGKMYKWITNNVKMLHEAGYILQFKKAGGTSQSQWNYAEVNVSYKEEV